MIYLFRGLKGEVLLGALLLATALLVSRSGFNQIVATVTREVLDLSRVQSSIVLFAGGLTAIHVTIVVAFIVDRRGPRWVMPLGALVASAGFLLLALASNFWGLVASSVVSGLGMAGVAPLILYAVAAKGCYRIRGTVIGALAVAIGLDLTPRVAVLFTRDFGWQWDAVPLGVLAIAGAVLLFTTLPRVFPVRQHPGTLLPWRHTAEDERSLTRRELRRLQGFWKVVGMAALVFGLGFALSSASSVHLVWLLRDDGPVRDGVLGVLELRGLVAALGAFLWGIASDFVRVRLLIPAASLLGMFGVVLLWLPGGSGADGLGAVVLGLAIGATWSLPWVLLADHVSVRFFATIGIGVSVVGGILGRILGPLLVGLALDSFGHIGVAGILILLALAFAVAGFMAPHLGFARVRRVDATIAG